jgi:hypothetical protein
MLHSKRRNTMIRLMREVVRVLLAFAVLSGGMWSGVSDVLAQEKGSTLAQQIQGSWILVSIYKEMDGKKIEPLGSKPRGSMILTPDGRFSIILLRANLPKFAANNRLKGTAQENQAVVQGSLASYGRYAVASEKEHTVNWFIEGSTFPNWDGQEQKRIMTVKGDEMRVINPTPSVRRGVNTIVWKRAK